jgi:hypothetical protein
MARVGSRRHRERSLIDTLGQCAPNVFVRGPIWIPKITKDLAHVKSVSG